MPARVDIRRLASHIAKRGLAIVSPWLKIKKQVKVPVASTIPPHRHQKIDFWILFEALFV